MDISDSTFFVFIFFEYAPQLCTVMSDIFPCIRLQGLILFSVMCFGLSAGCGIRPFCSGMLSCAVDNMEGPVRDCIFYRSVLGQLWSSGI